MNINDKNIENNIKIMSAAAGLSLAEVARRVGDSPQSLNQRLKQGKMQKDLDYLEKIADSCGFNFIWEFVKRDN